MAMFILICFANAQTSWQDYRYVTAGLKDDLSKGKNVKEGYSIVKIGTESSVSAGTLKRNAQLYYFKKGQTTKAFALQVWDTNNPNNYSFICIPTSDADTDIWKATFTDINAAGKEWHIVFAWALATVVSQKL